MNAEIEYTAQDAINDFIQQSCVFFVSGLHGSVAEDV